MNRQMTGKDVDAVRRGLETRLNTRITLRRLGMALGLDQGSARETVRRWVQRGPTGPAATALRLLGRCARDQSLQGVGISNAVAAAGVKALLDGDEANLADEDIVRNMFAAMMAALARELLGQDDTNDTDDR